MSAALAGLLGLAVGAAGRCVPVYREYSQPIRFFAEDESAQAAIQPASPDLQAVQALRDAKAQEAMMGKVTLLELAFPQGVSPFAETGSKPKMPLPVEGDRDIRRSSGDKGKNWLVHSLALPSLGQPPKNAAATAMSAGSQDSQWGWLADDVADQANRLADGSQEGAANEEYPSTFPTDPALNDGADPYNAERMASGRTPTEAEREAGAADATAPAGATARPLLPTHSAGNDMAMPSGLPPSGPDAGAAISTRRPTAMSGPEMSRTREVLANLIPNARPDFSPLRDSLADSSAPNADPTGGDSRRLFPERGMTDWVPPQSQGYVGARSSIGFGPVGVTALQPPTWQGRWGTTNASTGLSSLFESHSVSVFPAPLPRRQQNSSFPAPGSGGYKPVWQ